ncbi:transient receptor potential cation channel subfamily a member 1-like [Gigaspora margarita]|uniref:Transient receptor potential cation channel subfamily a member 1-like n=1 Tax=Gigaspora margarita TaxID=4874 RepID=A0A8H4EQT3_GIGMA|nr:transient receptor potential cation channel subfamily a member 1-like [Gigaspora margarita]
MTSNSDNSYMEISMEEAINKTKNKKILEIVCSPNLKHVAALHKDNVISLWSIVSQESLEEHLTIVKAIHIYNIRRNKTIRVISDDQYASIRKIFAISNNQQVSINLDRIDPYNFKIVDFETEKEIILTFSDWQKVIDFLSFRDNKSIIMVNAKYYRAYVFSIKGKNNMKWVCKSMIELQYFKQIYITPKGKLVIFNDTIHEITMWDIDDLSAKTRILIEWSHILQLIEISDDEELLAILTENKILMKKIFSTKKLVIDRIHLIASQKGERLLYRYIQKSVMKYCLMDPYNLKNPINASKLFENKQIQEQYIIHSDKIIYTNYGEVLIKKLVNDDWVEYLRKELKDTNSITTPSKNTFELITKIIKSTSYDPFRNKFEGKFLKWSLELNDESVKLIVNKLNTSFKKQLDILPSLKDINGNNFIIHCEVLENDDFVTITRIGVFNWTYKLSDIKMHYYWNDWNDSLENFIFEKIKLNILNENWTSERILPASSYETVLKNLHVKFGENELFKEFLISNIEDEFYLTCYGKDLMKAFIEIKDDKWIRTLGHNYFAKCLQENNHLISKISFLSIIFENFGILLENHPTFIASILFLIGFVVPSTIINQKSTSSHLSEYGRYYYLYNTSFIDILTSIHWDHWISFQKSFQKSFQNFQDNHPLFRDLIVQPVINYYDVGNMTTILAIPLPKFVINEEFYKYLNGEALLKFKWNTYGRKYYLIIWAIYTVFLLSFIIAATSYKNISQTSLFILLRITICLGIWHLFFELRQFICSPSTYMSSSWNILDLAAIIPTTITSIYWLKNGSTPTWAITFSALFFEIKFILFFRPNKFLGIYLAIIMKTVDKVISFLIIFGLFILVFAYTLHLLIGSESEIFQDSDINMFTQFGSAVIASYYMMITGDSTPISLWVSNENIMIMLLMLMVSFFLLIYLMNLFIGILSNLISNEDNYVAYLTLKSDIIEEIELFYMLPHQRRKQNWFPFIIFYECHIIKLREHIMGIQAKWTGYKKPYISKALNEILHLPEEPPSLSLIYSRIGRFEDNIEKMIQDLSILKQDIKELKESIEDTKTNK